MGVQVEAPSYEEGDGVDGGWQGYPCIKLSLIRSALSLSTEGTKERGAGGYEKYLLDPLGIFIDPLSRINLNESQYQPESVAILYQTTSISSTSLE